MQNINASPKVLQITGVIRRMVWLHIHKVFYTVTTTAGNGYINSPTSNGDTELVLEGESFFESFFSRKLINLSLELLRQIDAFKEEYSKLEAMISEERNRH